MIKLFKPRNSNHHVIHINYSDWGKNEKGYYFTVGTVRSQNKILLQFDYYVTGFGAVLKFVNDSKKYFLSKIEGLDCADGFITQDFGALENGQSLIELLKSHLN